MGLRTFVAPDGEEWSVWNVVPTLAFHQDTREWERRGQDVLSYNGPERRDEDRCETAGVSTELRRIAYQGEPGANSDIACRDAYPDWATLPCASFEDVFAAIAEGRAQLGMIPITPGGLGFVEAGLVGALTLAGVPAGDALIANERVYADVYLSSAPENAAVVLLVHGYDSSKEAHANQAMHVASWGMHAVAVHSGAGFPGYAASDHVPDRIALRGLRAHAHHGVYAFEWRQGQTFSCDALLEVDTRPAAETDALTAAAWALPAGGSVGGRSLTLPAAPEGSVARGSARVAALVIWIRLSGSGTCSA